MTEREKRIEEMALDGAECSHIAEWWDCKRCKHSPCGARRTCENLVDKDYRKADEVRKETAKDIIYGVANLVEVIEPDEEVAKHIYNHLFEDCKEYGLDENKFADRFGVDV